MELRKMISVFLIIILLLNMLLFAFNRIGMTQFWITIVVIAVLAFQVMPRIKK